MCIGETSDASGNHQAAIASATPRLSQAGSMGLESTLIPQC
jgi:hypothetical protein